MTAVAQGAPAATGRMRTHTVRGGGGLRLHVREWGREDGLSILFIHGWSQNHLCWAKQYESALAGEFRMLEYRWTVAEGTLPSLWLEQGGAFPWELRLLQGAAAVGAGVVVALLVRRTSHAAWAPLLAVVAVRLLLDPLGYSWYWLALQALMLVGAAELLSSPAFADLRRRISGSRAGVPMETG